MRERTYCALASLAPLASQSPIFYSSSSNASGAVSPPEVVQGLRRRAGEFRAVMFPRERGIPGVYSYRDERVATAGEGDGVWSNAAAGKGVAESAGCGDGAQPSATHVLRLYLDEAAELMEACALLLERAAAA